MRDAILSAKLAAAGSDFVKRLHRDAAALATFRMKLQSDADAEDVLESLQACAHKLAGAAGVFSFQAISQFSATLEQAVIDRRAGKGNARQVETAIEALVAQIECGPV